MSGFVPIFRLAAFRAAPAVLLATASSAALAQEPPAFGARAYSAADRVASTLLAGGMSQLAAITAQQRNASAPIWSAPVAEAVMNNRRLSDTMNKLPGWEMHGIRLILAPPAFSYSPSELVPAGLRELVAQPASVQPAIEQAQFFTSPRPVPPAPQAPRAGQPDVFGSIALSISRTTIDAKWIGASQPLPRNHLWNALIQTAQGQGRQQQAEMINRWVNQRLRFVDDRADRDSWAPAARTLTAGAGDCEDYAIAKMKLLEAAGFDRHAMFLVIARDLVRRADHAVLAVRIGAELMILDNMTDAVLPSSSVSDYRPILSFNAFGRWTHGYRVTKPQSVQFAAR